MEIGIGFWVETVGKMRKKRGRGYCGRENGGEKEKAGGFHFESGVKRAGKGCEVENI